MLHFLEQYIRGRRPALTPWNGVPQTLHVPETTGRRAASARPASARLSVLGSDMITSHFHCSYFDLETTAFLIDVVIASPAWPRHAAAHRRLTRGQDGDLTPRQCRRSRWPGSAASSSEQPCGAGSRC